jgi:hypothetical protein
MPCRLSFVLLVLLIFLVPANRTTAQVIRPPGCATLVPAGGDITGAIYAAEAGSTVCLAPGAHRPFVVDDRAPAGVTVRGAIPSVAAIVSDRGDAIQVLGTLRLTIADLTVRGGRPTGLYAQRSPELVLRNLRVESSTFGIHLDDRTTARLDGVTIARSAQVGLLLRSGARAFAERVRIPESEGTGIAAIAGAGLLTLHESEIGTTPGPALFAGKPGCGNLAPATLDPPRCFLDEPDAYVAENRVAIDGLLVHDGPGPGLVFYPGVHAEVRGARVVGRRLSGLFAWGARVDVMASEFEGNLERGIEYRAYPDPRAEPRREASGKVVESTVRGTLPLGGPLVGDGIIAQGAQLSVLSNTVDANAGNGIAFAHGTIGEIIGNTVTGNGRAGICTGPDVAMFEFENSLAENHTDAVDLCVPAAPPPANAATPN